MNCKPGDLALVISRGAECDNTGKTVRVDRWVQGYVASPCGDDWWCTGAWWCASTGSGLLTGRGDAAAERPFPDWMLMPLRPEDAELVEDLREAV